MNNELFFNSIKDNYDNLKNFILKNNTLFFYDNEIYMIPLNHITLQNINPNLFLLNSKDIYRIIYMLELLPQKELNEQDKFFVTQYVKKYLELESNKLANESSLEHEIDCLGMPIYFSDDPSLTNTPCSMLIHSVIEDHLNNVKEGKDRGPRLILHNPNFIIPEENNDLEYLEKAGFTTILLIASTVIITCIFLAIMMT